MLRWVHSSLPVRAGLAVMLIAILALGSALSAGVIAWLSEDDAAAINTAGSLRMATYRLSWKLEAGADSLRVRELSADIQDRLDSQALHQVLRGTANSPLHLAYAELQDRWRNELSPALEQGDHAAFQADADNFVEQLDHFVLLLQQQSERKQSWQQGIQGMALFITVIVLLVGMYELQGSVISPLQELVGATERFRAGDLGARVNYRSEDELGQMALSFNAMADAIEESHRTLESRVAQKTLSLAQSKAALELLYHSSRSIASGQANAERLDELLNSFQTRLPGLRLTLCLHGGNREPAEQLIALHGNETREICAGSDCATCERQHRSNLLTCLVHNQGNHLGELRAHFRDGRAPQPWEKELIQALADLIGTALSLERTREHEHRLLLFEERAIIARELHDSLAQALSYMKLQVSRLQTLMHRGESYEQLEAVSDELRDGLNNAYRQLRELLTTFRLQIQEGGLDQALDDTTREFAERGNFPVLLETEPLACNLTANEQIHLLQIVREALSNCARHSRAEHVWVHLRQLGEEVELSIEDDGIGLSLEFDQRQHHGLNIMQERTRSLHGQFSITRREPHGTRIHLLFRPHFLGRNEERTVA
jgi:two-component system nitrate/nitrite sensor histidine kinase NarX